MPQKKYIHPAEDFYNHEYCANFAAELAVGFQDSFKYLFSLGESMPEHEDNALLTPELLREYDNIYMDCLEVVKAYEYYRKKVKIEPAPLEDDFFPL